MRIRNMMKPTEEDKLEGFGYYSQAHSNSSKRAHIAIVLIALVLMWYSGAVVTITTTKVIMNATKLPFLLCTVQFVFASLLANIYLRLTKTGSPHPLQSGISSIVFQIAVSYTFGFILTNTAFSIVSAAFAETVKSSEPISTVLIGMFFLSETVSMRTYATLIPICCGVAFSCYNDDSFNLLGFILAAASNFCFSTRAVLARKMNLQFPDGIDDITMFAMISSQGLVFLAPITLLVEGSTILNTIYDPPKSGDGAFSMESTLLFGVLLVNGFMFALYNLVSYLVLRRSDLITHSVLNAFRRVFIILFTTYFFNNVLSAFNVLGIAIAIVGVVLFGYSKSLDKPKAEV